MQRSKLESYLLTLKNEKVKSYKIIALIFVLSNLAIFLFFLIFGLHFNESAAALLLSGLYVIYLSYAAKKKREKFFINEFAFFILAGCWVGLQNYLIAFSLAMLGILYYLSLQKLQFLFTDASVNKMNFPQKKFPWEVFSNVLIKDNILTMDFKNNKLIQLEAENDIDEIQFNEFAKSRLNKSS